MTSNPGFFLKPNHRVGPTVIDLSWTVGPPVQLPKHVPMVSVPDLPEPQQSAPVHDSVSSFVILATALFVLLLRRNA